MKVDINNKAAIVSKQSIKIDAPTATVWTVITQVNKWHEWQPRVKKAHLAGPFGEGESFEWTGSGMNIKSKIHTCEPFVELGWTGNSIGTVAIHNWSLVSIKDGTIVTVEESLTGFLPSLLKLFIRKKITNGVMKSLEDLKKECEK